MGMGSKCQTTMHHTMATMTGTAMTGHIPTTPQIPLPSTCMLWLHT